MAQQFKGSLQEQSQQARALWGSAPWTLADQCSKLSHEELGPELQQAQEWCGRYAQQLQSQKETLQIKEALPETDLQLFTGKKTSIGHQLVMCVGCLLCRIVWENMLGHCTALSVMRRCVLFLAVWDGSCALVACGTLKDITC